MTLATIRLGWRIQRSEFFWALAIIVALALGIAVTSVGMQSILAEDPVCAADLNQPACTGVIRRVAGWEQTLGSLVMLLWAVPIVLGSVVGVGVTAGELERGTARWSWALSRSRAHWLLVRVVPAALAVVALLSMLAFVAELGVRSRIGSADPGFNDYQLRSLLLPMRGLLSFVIGLFVGLGIGRSLPAVLVAMALGAAATMGHLLVAETWQLVEATFVTINDPALATNSPMIVGTRAPFAGAQGDGLLIIPASAFWTWVLREAALMAIAIGAVLLFVRSLVDHRSPS